jgi:hypothetical protein
MEQELDDRRTVDQSVTREVTSSDATIFARIAGEKAAYEAKVPPQVSGTKIAPA